MKFSIDLLNKSISCLRPFLIIIMLLVFRTEENEVVELPGQLELFQKTERADGVATVAD